MKIKKLIGTKEFYRMVLVVAVPIMVQNGITNFVSLLDNIMVGRVGTEQMSGVAIVNQLLFVFRLAVFGSISGAGIFGAQFFGCGDYKGVRNTMRFKIYAGLVCAAVGALVFTFLGEPLISLYLRGGGDVGDVGRTLQYGRSYLLVMMAEMLPFAATQIYASTMRECGETMIPMKAGLTAVCVNLLGNYLLIFGKFGFPCLGVQGAAAATVIARFVECGIVASWAHTHKEKMPYIKGLYPFRSGERFTVPADLAGKILLKGFPLMANEVMWAAGMAVMTQCYSLRGLAVIAGLNISTTIVNIFNGVFIALGDSVAILVGQLLGAGKMEEARDTDHKLLAFSVFCCVILGSVLALVSPLFPRLYATADEVRALATRFICISALCMPMQAFIHASYFTLRSGGKTVITFIFDSFYVWMVSIPLAFCLSRYTQLPIVQLYLACQLVDIIKCMIGFILVKKGIWMNNIVGGKHESV